MYFQTMSPKETICAGFSNPGLRCEELCKFLLDKLYFEFEFGLQNIYQQLSHAAEYLTHPSVV